MHVIVTRPHADAVALEQKLHAMGHEVRCLPLLAIVPRRPVTIPARPYQAICITSANGLQPTLDVTAQLTTPLFSVGPQSAAAARRFGFTRVAVHGGDVRGLAEACRAQLRPDQGPILYLSGAETSGDLEGQLRMGGFDVDRIVTYDARPLRVDDLRAALHWGQAVLHFSPRSAGLWMQALDSDGLDASSLLHCCLSANVAARLPQSWTKRIAATPDESAILATLDRPGKDE